MEMISTPAAAVVRRDLWSRCGRRRGWLLPSARPKLARKHTTHITRALPHVVQSAVSARFADDVAIDAGSESDLIP